MSGRVEIELGSAVSVNHDGVATRRLRLGVARQLRPLIALLNDATDEQQNETSRRRQTEVEDQLLFVR